MLNTAKAGTMWLACALALLGYSAISHAAPAIDAEHRATFVTLGTGGGPIIRVKRSEPANAVIIGNQVYLFDVGDGVQRQLQAAGIQQSAIKAIFISHHHIDHNGGLGPLLASRWLMRAPGKVAIIGPSGTVALVNGLSAAYAPIVEASQTLGAAPSKPIADSTAPQDMALTMDVPTLVFQDANIRVLAITNNHYNLRPTAAVSEHARSYAFRIEAGGRSFVYTGDTGPSPRVELLAKGADMLISEVINLASVRAVLEKTPAIPASFYAPIMAHMVQDHLTPQEVGKMAAAAGVKEVILTHLTMGLDDEKSTAGYTEGIAPTFKGRVRVANDLDRF